MGISASQVQVTTVSLLMIAFAHHVSAHHVSPSDAQASQSRPIELGTSGSSREHVVSKNRLFCYTGTLGALVSKGGRDYILSNNHVLAKENGLLDQGTGQDGEIIQPGLLDAGSCTLTTGDNVDQVATLSEFVEIQFGQGKNKPLNYVDAAIAEVDANDVDASGTILGIGPLGSGLVPAEQAIGHKVQKTGRTTGHTFGTVLALEATIDVKYDSGTARFADQLRIRHACEGEDFSDSGDSGSLVVTAPSQGNPSSVGLLFAGGDADTFANPMSAVMGALGITQVSGPEGDTQGALEADYNVLASSCDTGGGGGGGGRPGGPGGGGRPFETVNPMGLAIAREVKSRYSDALFALPDVVGHGIGMDGTGALVIEIYVASNARRDARRPLPVDVEGIPVRVVETGEIRAF